MGRDYAKQKVKAASRAGSFSEDAVSPDSIAPRDSTSTAPTSPLFPLTPACSFVSTFGTESSADPDRSPSTSTVGSPAYRRPSSDSRSSSFSDKLRQRILDKILDPSVQSQSDREVEGEGDSEAEEAKQKLRNPPVLEKEGTKKLTRFWELIHGRGDYDYNHNHKLLPTISEDSATQPQSDQAEGEERKFGFASPLRIFKSKRKMDPSRLAPSTYEAPNRARQIQDAKDMYTTIARNAERAGSEVPPYDFIELIGKGGYGRVYKCRKRATGGLVAVKIINIDDADFREHVLDKDNTISSFQKEVGILQQLKDSKAKNINMIHDAFDLHNQLWIVSDYCTGGSLRTLMRANPKKGFEEHFIIPVARELAVALKSVHDIGVIHRDIKCANVYVNEEGNIQLGDFGIVGELDDGTSKRRTIVGTPHYLPLEMHTSRTHQTDEAYGTEVDIWSYGITVYEMATGLPPYTNVPPERLAEATVKAPRLEGGDYSDELRDFVAFCLNSDPKLRPSAEQVLQHPYIAGTEKKYPTSSLIKLIERFVVWEYGGGQRQSLFFAGGAAAPIVSDDPPEEEEATEDWNFSTSDSFNADFGRRYSQMIATQDFAGPHFDAPAGSGLPPIVTKDLSRMEQVEQHFKDLSANRGERSLDRLFNPESKPYELHTPEDDDLPSVSDLPLRNMASTAPTRESLIDLDSAADMDVVPQFNFDFSDIPTVKARTSKFGVADDDEEYQYGSQGNDERRATMEWKFPSTSQSLDTKRSTMEWTFQTAEPAEPDEAEQSMNLPPIGSEGLPPGFRPTLKHTMTQPVGQFDTFVHSTQSAATSSSPIRDSIRSMIDLDMSLTDPADIIRPATASSATSAAGSTNTEMTSGNPFDLEEDPEQRERDRNRFSYHKQWQSDGGHPKRASHKTMQMHTRGNSMTSPTETDLDYGSRNIASGEENYNYDYSREMSDAMHNQIAMQMPENDVTMNHWPSFGSDHGLDDVSRYQYPPVPRLDEPAYSSQDRTRLNGSSAMGYGKLRGASHGRGAQQELEYPETTAPHPDALVEEADPRAVVAELDRLLDDFGQSMRSTIRALRLHTGVQREHGSSETDSGMESNAAFSEDDGYRT